MATRTISNAGGNWDSTGTWVEGVVPTSADDVVATATSGNLTINVAAACRSLDLTGYVGTLTHNASITLSIGDASGGALTFVVGMTYTRTATSSIIALVSTSDNGGAGWPVTTAGKSLGRLTIDGVGGKWSMQDALTTGGIFMFTNGHLKTNNHNMSVSTLSAGTSVAGTRVWEPGSSTLTPTSTGSTWVIAAAGTTIMANTATINSTQQTGMTSAAAGIDWNGMSITMGGLGGTVGGTNFKDITYTGSASKLGLLRFYGDCTITGTLTVTGNSVTNRVLLGPASGWGRAVTINANAISGFANIDFHGIIAQGALAADFTGISGGAGDGGGNTGMTLTPAVNRYAVVSGNTSSTVTWSATSGGAGGASVPLPQDNVFFDANSAAGTYVVDMPRMGKDADFTGFTRTFRNSTPTSVYGDLIFGSGMTFGSMSNILLSGAGTHTFDTAGLTLAGTIGVDCLGSYTLAGDANLAGLIHQGGDFSTDNHTINTTALIQIIALTGGGFCDFGTSTINLLQTVTGTHFSATSTAANTLDLSAAEIVLANSSANTRTIGLPPASMIVGALTYTVAGSTGTIAIATGVNSGEIGTLNVGPGRTVTISTSVANPRWLKVTNWNVNGESGSQTTVASSAAGVPVSLIKVGGGLAGGEYLTIRDTAASPDYTWYVDPGGVDDGGNTGWTFNAVPSEPDPDDGIPEALALEGSSAFVSTASAELSLAVGLAGTTGLYSAATSVRFGSKLGLSGNAGVRFGGSAELVQNFTYPLQGTSRVQFSAVGVTALRLGLAGRTSAHFGSMSSMAPAPTYIFNPPVVFDVPPVLPTTKGIAYRLFRHYGPRPRGRSVIRIGDEFQTVDSPDQLTLAAVDEYWLGGHEYVIDKATMLALTEAGYGAYIS